MLFLAQYVYSKQHVFPESVSLIQGWIQIISRWGAQGGATALVSILKGGAMPSGHYKDFFTVSLISPWNLISMIYLI